MSDFDAGLACFIFVPFLIGVFSLHVNDSAAPLGSNRDRHANVEEGLLGEKLAVFLGHPRLQKLPAVLETPGPENRGPDANEVRKTKELARKGARRRGRSATRRGAR